jgi:hypothetical protein
MEREALKLALKVLKDLPGYRADIDNAITELEEALAQPAQEPVAWMVYTKDGQSVYVTDNPTDIQESQRALPLYTAPPQPEQEQDFIKHEVENKGDWSEWVNPYAEQYFIKCCDCGLVHEMQFKVAKYAEGDECEFVEDANLQTVFRARRATPQLQEFVCSTGLCHFTLTQTNVGIGERGMEAYEAAKERGWVDLTDEEIDELHGSPMQFENSGELNWVRIIEAKLKEKNNG